MKKFISFALLTLMLASCGGTPVETQKYENSDLTFDYPIDYTVKRAATRYVIEDAESEKVLTMYRYLAETPDEVIAQMKIVNKICKYEKGGVKFGGYKSYKISLDDSDADSICDLGGDLITNGDGIMILFIENKADEVLFDLMKSSFEFVN